VQLLDLLEKGLSAPIVPLSQFDLLAGKEELSIYRFNTRVAEHMFCRTCGIHPFYVPRSDPDKIDVNARCLEGVDVRELRPKPFDGKNWERSMAGKVPWR
jgi:hypothetical protein